MRRLAFAALALVLLRADMFPDASNAKLPEAINELGSARIYTPYQYGGKGNASRQMCAVTTNSGSAAITMSGCTFTAADVGKILVVNNTATATTPLVTTIAAVVSGASATMGAPAGVNNVAVSLAVTRAFDDGPAIQSCLNDAVEPQGKPQGMSYCYIPPGTWGTAQSIELYPMGLFSKHNTTLKGAGPNTSRIVALASLPYLAHRDGGYDAGGSVDSVGFDGNKLAVDTGYFVCPSFHAMNNVAFDNAAGGADLVYGDATGTVANCNTGVVRNIQTLNYGSSAGGWGPGGLVLYPTEAELPPYNIKVGTTDNTFYNIYASNARTAGVWLQAAPQGAFNTQLFQSHFASPNIGNTATGILVEAVKQGIYAVECDAGIGTCIDIQAGNTRVVGGLMQNTGYAASGVGVNIGASVPDVSVMGFDASAMSVQGNRIKSNIPVSGSLCVTGNPGALTNCYPRGGFAVLGSDNSVQLTVVDTPGAVNYVTTTGIAAGAAPLISAAGTDPNISLRIGGKGTGVTSLGATGTGGVAINGKLRPQGAAPALTACGTSPAIIGNDTAGEITMGTGSPAGCTVTFAVAYVNRPYCVVTWRTPLPAQTYSVSNSVLALTQTATSSNVVQYICLGQAGG